MKIERNSGKVKTIAFTREEVKQIIQEHILSKLSAEEAENIIGYHLLIGIEGTDTVYTAHPEYKE